MVCMAPNTMAKKTGIVACPVILYVRVSTDEQATSGLGRIELASSEQEGSLHLELHFTAGDVIAPQTVALDADDIEANH